MAKTATALSLFDEPADNPPVAVAAPVKAVPPVQPLLNLFDQMLGLQDDDNIFDVSGLEHVAGKTVAEIFGWDDVEPEPSPTPPERVLLPRPFHAGVKEMLQTQAPFSPFQGKEAMEWEKARTAFGHAVRAAGRDSEILTYPDFVSAVPGKLDHRKLARLANSLLGRVASDKPEPKTCDWKAATAALGGQRAGQGAAQ